MDTTYDPFELQGRGPRKRRSPHTRPLASVADELIGDALPSLCDNRVLMAEVGAASMCIGYYIGELFGERSNEFGASPPEPALRILDQHGLNTRVHPFARALSAAALARLTSDPDAHDLARRIIERDSDANQQHPWPRWRELPLVVPEAAWLSRDEQDRVVSLVTSWRDADGEPHAFATMAYEYSIVGDDVGEAIDSIIIADTADELLTMMSEPIDDLDGMHFEEISLADAHEVLRVGISDVALAARRMLPRDLPVTTLAFLEHRRDLLG
jgi:hypothetical protein